MKKYILTLLCLFCASGAVGYFLGGDEAKPAAAETPTTVSVPATDKVQEQAAQSALKPAN